MIDKSYYKNMPSKNILRESKSNYHITDHFTPSMDIPLENLIINSNLENESIIK